MTRIAVLSIGCALSFASCNTGSGLVLNELVDARSTAAAIRIDFLQAVDRSSQAVMADTDEATALAAHDAHDARARVDGGVVKLEGTLKALGYGSDAKLLDGFNAKYAEYASVDDKILALAVENSNLKAQRLAFGPGRDAVASVRLALEGAASHAPAKSRDRVDGLVSSVAAALLDVEVTEAQHIAEADDRRMSEMEARIMRLLAAAARCIDRLQAILPDGAHADIARADAAFETFTSTDAEVIQLSRRNTNVKSLALTLGRKRALAAECEDALAALTSALEQHPFAGVR